MVVIDNADLAELQSSLFTGVTVGLGSQVLNFENSVSILIQCPFKCEIEGGVKWGHGEEAIDSALLFSFLNHRVEQVSIESDGTLIMRFDVGGGLFFLREMGWSLTYLLAVWVFVLLRLFEVSQRIEKGTDLFDFVRALKISGRHGKKINPSPFCSIFCR